MEITISAIAHSYWRTIKRGKRTYESVPNQAPDYMRLQVRELARADVENDVITAEEFYNYIGEVYTA